MKQKDILVVIVVIVFSVIVSYLVAAKFISTPSNRQQNVQQVGSISSQFSTPSSKYFNDGSIDPSELVQTGNQQNQTPFGSAAP